MYSRIIFRGFLNANLGKYGQLITAIALLTKIVFLNLRDYVEFTVCLHLYLNIYRTCNLDLWNPKIKTFFLSVTKFGPNK